MRQLRIGVFDNPQANSGGRSTWRHPDSRREFFDTLGYWRDLAEVCEQAAVDFLFLGDAWGWSEIDGRRPDVATVEGLDLPRLDPAVVLGALVPLTTRLGLVMTGSVLLEEPYGLARRLASLDHLSGGRIGWNIVTTGTADTAVKAFGRPMVDHDERYRMAEDFLELTYRLWEGAWEPSALERDKAGRFADPAKVHRIVHQGPYFRCDGYGNSSYSPQGTPVLFQAGASAAGRRLGGRHGECIFLGSGSAEQLAGYARAIRTAAAEFGRGPADVKVMAAFGCVWGGTEAEARRRHQQILRAQTAAATVASYAMFTGIDLASYPPDTPMEQLSTELSRTQVSRFAGRTVGQVLADWRVHGVGGAPVVGTAEHIADEICALAEAADLDGILLDPLIQPASTLDFVAEVLPVLRARGVVAGDEGASMLRERLFGHARLPDNHPAARFR